MKILVISDTHGYTKTAEKIIRDQENLDMILHLGDYFRDAESLMETFPNIPFEYIYGNSDFMIGDVPSEKLLTINGKKIFMTHGHRYSVKWSYDKLLIKLQKDDIDLLLFGHTHIAAKIPYGDKYILNPGSVSDPRDDQNESYAVIEINGNEIKSEIFYLEQAALSNF